MQATDVTETRKASAFEAGLWRAWTALIWVIPLLLLFARFVLPGAGWEALFMLLYFPVWYPLLALTGMVPRWVWRRRVDRAGLDRDTPPPASLLACIIAHWGGLALAVVVTPGVSDGADLDPLLSKLIPVLDSRGLQIVATGAVLLALAGLVGAIVVACTGGVALPSGQTRRHGWVAIAIAFTLAPLLIVVGAVLQFSVMQGATDPAGRTELDAKNLTEEDSIAVENAAWEELQNQTTGLRAAIAEDGWLIRRSSGISSGDSPKGMHQTYVDWEARSDEPIEELLERANSALAAGGWQPDREWVDNNRKYYPDDAGFTEVGAAIEYTDVAADDGATIHNLISINDAGETARYSFWTVPSTGTTGVTLWVTGKNYWAGQRGFISLTAADLAERYPELNQPVDGFAATAWPGLGSVLNIESDLEASGKFPGEE